MNVTTSAATGTAQQHGRTLRIPGGFQTQLIKRLARRSPFVSVQLESFGENGGIVELPEVEGSLWLDAIFSTPAELKAASDTTLVDFLKASGFFQDAALIESLCSLLANRLFKGASLEHSLLCNHRKHVATVLDDVSADLVMEMLRSAPGGIVHKLTQLPQPIRSLAVLAASPELAATCTAADQLFASSREQGLLTLTVCVAMPQAAEPQAAAEGPHEDSSTVKPTSCTDVAVHGNDVEAEVIAGASMWPTAAPVTEDNLDQGLYTLQKKEGILCARMQTSPNILEGFNITLSSDENAVPACIVIGPGSGAVHVKGAQFRGGAVVCMGGECHVTFDDCLFHSCSLVVLDGAQATLKLPKFQYMCSSASLLSICAHGAATKVVVNGGTIEGGHQGVAVLAGAHFEASELDIEGAKVIGVEVKSEGSSLSLNSCNIQPQMSTRGVYVHTGSRAQLSCTTLKGARGSGLCVQGAASHAEASSCCFLQNSCGALADNAGHVVADACESSGNEHGYAAIDQGSVMELTACTSTADSTGCSSSARAKLSANKVTVSESKNYGFTARTSSQLVLRDCSADTCMISGICALGTATAVHAEGCSLVNNGRYGIIACRGAVVDVRRCSSSMHCTEFEGVPAGAGYVAQGGASRMTVSCSSSEGDRAHCHVEGGGHLVMDKVTVDGSLQSGSLPRAG